MIVLYLPCDEPTASIKQKNRAKSNDGFDFAQWWNVIQETTFLRV